MVLPNLCWRRHNSDFFFNLFSIGKCLPANSAFNQKLLAQTATAVAVCLVLIGTQVQQEDVQMSCGMSVLAGPGKAESCAFMNVISSCCWKDFERDGGEGNCKSLLKGPCFFFSLGWFSGFLAVYCWGASSSHVPSGCGRAAVIFIAFLHTISASHCEVRQCLQKSFSFLPFLA